MSAQKDLFTFTRDYSRFWLPPLLDDLAGVPPTFCEGDGCSIFLRIGNRLHLAASTRESLKSRLFEDDFSYSTDPDDHHRAAELFDETGEISPQAGLTGWCAAFDRVLNIENLRSPKEIVELGDAETPVPVWSDRARGFFDFEGRRPFLAVPMRSGGNVYGAIRVYKIQAQAEPFTARSEARLLEFASALARFVITHDLLAPDIRHYFKIWTADTDENLAHWLTEAVPSLFGVDTCSLFLRDAQNRFVLRNASVSGDLQEKDRDLFEVYLRENRGNLYYRPSEDSKTGLCLLRQAPILLTRDENREWRPADGSPSPELRQESGGEFLREVGEDIPSCELDKRRSECILLIPVRDKVNPRLLQGLLRVVSTDKSLAKETQTEVTYFAGILARRLSETQKRKMQRQASQNLIRRLGELSSEGERWNRAARIVAEALQADAVTVFVFGEDGKLRSAPDYSYLNEEQMRWDLDAESVAEQKEHYNVFRQHLLEIRYEPGQGRTGWVAARGETLKLKDLEDGKELERRGAEPNFSARGASCELVQAGPFLAVPVFRREGEVKAVIRSLRWRRSPRGPFSAAHVTVAETCAAVLTALPSMAIEPPMAVVMSFHRRWRDAQRELHQFLAAIGYEPLALVDDAPELHEAWDAMKGRARAAIAIATPDDPAAGRHQPSGNVIAEIQQFADQFRGRTIVCREASVTLPDMVDAKAIHQVEFGREFGICQCFLKVAELLANWR